MNHLHVGFNLSLLLLVIGGLNWGLIGIFNFNLVEFLFGTTALTRIVYILVGLAGLYAAVRAPMLMMTNQSETGHPAT